MSRASIRGIEAVRLFVSYQRYSLVIFGAVCALASSTYLLAQSGLAGWIKWPLAILVGLFAIRCLHFFWVVASAWPRKRRATELAIRRIESQRFQPRSLRRYFEDPCYRVVGREILRRSGLSRIHQQEIIRELSHLARQPDFKIYVNPELSHAHSGQAVQVEGALATSPALANTHNKRNER